MYFSCDDLAPKYPDVVFSTIVVSTGIPEKFLDPESTAISSRHVGAPIVWKIVAKVMYLMDQGMTAKENCGFCIRGYRFGALTATLPKKYYANG